MKDWFAKYETLTDMVVPASSRLIFEDNEYKLFSVTLFKKVIDEYKLRCRENKLITVIYCECKKVRYVLID